MNTSSFVNANNKRKYKVEINYLIVTAISENMIELELFRKNFKQSKIGSALNFDGKTYRLSFKVDKINDWEDTTKFINKCANVYKDLSVIISPITMLKELNIKESNKINLKKVAI